jgi:exosome complex component RRP41
MDGHLTLEEFDNALNMAIKGCQVVSDLQKKTIRDKYQSLLEVE